MDQAWTTARALLAAVAAEGAAPLDQVEALVAAVLGDELVALALAAREPGPHQLRRALELAAAVCARAVASTSTPPVTADG